MFTGVCYMFNSKKLNRVRNISLEDVAMLDKAQIKTCHDFLTFPPSELMKILSCSHAHYHQLLLLVSQSVAPSPQTAFSMHKCSSDRKNIFTSLQMIDSRLSIGLPAGTITEITGPSGCGKTQFCIMLTVIGCLPIKYGGIDSKVVYIDTEGSFTAHRLEEMAKSRYPECYDTEEKIKEMMSKVLIFKELSCSELNKRLECLDYIATSDNVGLVIVDSIASLLRKEFDSRTSKGLSDRLLQLSKQATLLKYVAQRFNIPVIVTNQITTRFVLGNNDKQIVASLGNYWSHCVNTRLVMEFCEDGKRKLSIAKSPVSESVSIVVTLEDKGLVVDQNDTELLDNPLFEGDATKYSLTVRTDI